jgi:hypothetical protein
LAVERSSFHFELLSSDNAFLNDIGITSSYFDQRTLLTSFRRDDKSLFVQKPIYNLMALLGLLGDEHVRGETTGDARYLATKRIVAGEHTVFSALLVNADSGTGDAYNATVLLPGRVSKF